MSPIDLQLFPGGGLKADKGTAVFDSSQIHPPLVQVANNSDPAGKPLLLKPLEYYGSMDIGVLFQERVDQLAIRIQFGGFGFPRNDRDLRSFEILLDAVPVDPEFRSDLSGRKPHILEPMNLKNRPSVNHCRPPAGIAGSTGQ